MESQVGDCYPSTGAIVKTPTSFRTEQRSVIKYCANAEMTPTDTFKFMERDRIERSAEQYCLIGIDCSKTTEKNLKTALQSVDHH